VEIDIELVLKPGRRNVVARPRGFMASIK
jgi:hypothetical protein